MSHEEVTQTLKIDRTTKGHLYSLMVLLPDLFRQNSASLLKIDKEMSASYTHRAQAIEDDLNAHHDVFDETKVSVLYGEQRDDGRYDVRIFYGNKDAPYAALKMADKNKAFISNRLREAFESGGRLDGHPIPPIQTRSDLDFMRAIEKAIEGVPPLIEPKVEKRLSQLNALWRASMNENKASEDDINRIVNNLELALKGLNM